LNSILHNNGKRTYLNSRAKCFGQHVPPSAITFYTGKKTFCVVRDPYSRMISIFGYRTKMFNPQTGNCTVENLNNRLTEWIKMFKGDRGKKSMPYLHDCHMLPQVAWVYGWNVDKGEVDQKGESCNKILRFEQLTTEFNTLMQSNGYIYRLGNQKKLPSEGACATFKKADLWQRTRELIEDVYRDDFALLKYPIMKKTAKDRKDLTDSRISLCPGQSTAPQTNMTHIMPIELIHIPRTGGTTIEFCTSKETVDEYKWGSSNKELHGEARTYLNKKGGRCWGQHAPPTTVNFYSGKETFCVVRDPYARLISEFGHQQAMYSHRVGDCSVENMNQRLMEWIREMKYGVNNQKPVTYLHDCHMLPQAAYTHGWDAEKEIVNKSILSCKYMLRFEDYQNQFNALMHARGYPYRLNQHKLQGSGKACAALKKDDLWKKTKEMLKEVYRIDFELLGYPLD